MGPVGGEDDELRFQEDVAEDGEADAGVALDAAEAGPGCGGGGVVHVRAGHGGRVAADAEADVRQRCGAVEYVAAVGLAVGGTGDLGVVCGDDVVVGQEQ